MRKLLACAALAPFLVLFGVGFAACGGDDTTQAGGGPGDVDGSVSDGAFGDVTVGDGASGDGGANDGASCVPKACPPNFQCGDYDDGCGHTIACGKACTGGVCDSTTHTCVDKSTSCAAQHAQCGIVKDACGVGYDCGACMAGQVCDSATHTCVPASAAGDGGACTPGQLTCTGPNGPLCGTISDGCGATKQCSCPQGQQCGGGGVPGVCGVPAECNDGGACGSFTNACGSAYVSCGGCATGSVCNAMHQCTSCTPNLNGCQGKTCGSASDGCGGSVSCGSCAVGTVCHDGACCTPLTCDGIAADAGVEGGADAGTFGCNPIPDGCGGTLECGMACAVGTQRCVNNSCADCPDCSDGGTCDNNAQCCYPKACSAVPNAGCQPVNLGCGKYQVCNPCPASQVCLGDGTCCVPQGCNGRVGLVDDGCGRQVYCPAPK